MKKTRKRISNREPQQVTAEPTRPLDRDALRSQISNLVCADAVTMVEKIIAGVDGAHYQSMKYLFEMIGLFPAAALPEVPQEDSLAGLLLNRLGIEDEALAEVQPGHAWEKTGVQQGNTVE
jgi:hypothetical protein